MGNGWFFPVTYASFEIVVLKKKVFGSAPRLSQKNADEVSFLFDL